MNKEDNITVKALIQKLKYEPENMYFDGINNLSFWDL